MSKVVTFTINGQDVSGRDSARLDVGGAGLVQAYPPVLPDGWRSLTLTNVAFRGRHYAITVDRDADGKPRLRREPRSKGETP